MFKIGFTFYLHKQNKNYIQTQKKIFYILDKNSDLWGWLSQTAPLTNDLLYLGNGTSGWEGGITFHNPVKIKGVR